MTRLFHLLHAEVASPDRLKCSGSRRTRALDNPGTLSVHLQVALPGQQSFSLWPRPTTGRIRTGETRWKASKPYAVPVTMMAGVSGLAIAGTALDINIHENSRPPVHQAIGVGKN